MLVASLGKAPIVDALTGQLGEAAVGQQIQPWLLSPSDLTVKVDDPALAVDDDSAVVDVDTPIRDDDEAIRDSNAAVAVIPYFRTRAQGRGPVGGAAIRVERARGKGVTEADDAGGLDDDIPKHPEAAAGIRRGKIFAGGHIAIPSAAAPLRHLASGRAPRSAGADRPGGSARERARTTTCPACSTSTATCHARRGWSRVPADGVQGVPSARNHQRQREEPERAGKRGAPFLGYS